MSFRSTVAKIHAKTFIFQLINWILAIRCSIFRTLEVILHRFEVCLQKIRA